MADTPLKRDGIGAPLDTSGFFKLFFGELERREIPCVILHSYEQLPENIASDIDFAVPDADVMKARGVLAEAAAKAGWLIVQTLQYDIASFYTVAVNPQQPEQFLKLDECSHYTRNGCLFIRDEILLAHRRAFNGFHVPSPSSEFIYTLAKVFAKGKEIAGYLPRLRELWMQEPKRGEELFHAVFGAEQGTLEAWFGRPAELWKSLAKPMHDRNHYRWPQKIREWRRRWQRGSEPTGLRVAILGADPQLADELGDLLLPCFRRQRVIELFNAAAPDSPPGRGAVGSLLHVNGLFLKSLFSFWRKEWLAVRRSTLVMLVPYFDDLFLHPQRYRICNSNGLIRLLRWFLPQPDLILAFKNENESRAEKDSALLHLLSNSPHFHLLVCPDSELPARAAWKEVVQFLARRSRNRDRLPENSP